MPTMEGYEHADIPHEKTVMPVGYLYGCHTTEPDNPRGHTTEITGQDGYFDGGDADFPQARTARTIRIVTEWLPVKCGHMYRSTDPACTGCTNRSDES